MQKIQDQRVPPVETEEPRYRKKSQGTRKPWRLHYRSKMWGNQWSQQGSSYATEKDARQAYETHVSKEGRRRRHGWDCRLIKDGQVVEEYIWGKG